MVIYYCALVHLSTRRSCSGRRRAVRHAIRYARRLNDDGGCGLNDGLRDDDLHDRRLRRHDAPGWRAAGASRCSRRTSLRRRSRGACAGDEALGVAELRQASTTTAQITIARARSLLHPNASMQPGTKTMTPLNRRAPAFEMTMSAEHETLHTKKVSDSARSRSLPART
jgi:hypothetical protein